MERDDIVMPKKQIVVVLTVYFLAYLTTLMANFTEAIIDQRLEFGEEGTAKLFLSLLGVMAMVSFLFVKGYKFAKAFAYLCLFINLAPGAYYWWEIGFRPNLGTALTLFAIGCFIFIAYYQRRPEIVVWLRK